MADGEVLRQAQGDKETTGQGDGGTRIAGQERMGDGDVLVVDLENLYIDDLELFADMQGGKFSREVIDLLDRVVVGGVRGRKLPFSRLREVGKALQAAMEELGNPGGN